MINLTAEVVATPILVVCLGGTGKQVFRHLRAMLTDLSETLPDNARSAIQPFYIDADRVPDGQERAYHFYYTDFNVFAGPVWENYREQRFPPNLGSKIITDSRFGAGAVRVFGNASLAASRDKIRELLEQARKLTPEPYQRVFIVGGGCGGTAGSQFIDLAASIVEFYRSYGQTVPIDIVLTGPEIQYEGHIQDTVSDRMKANHYALLKELNHYCHHPFSSAYRSMDPELQINNTAGGERLFDWVYYFNDCRPQQEITWLIAEMLMHFGLSAVGGDLASILPNERENRDLQYPLDFVHADHEEICS